MAIELSEHFSYKKLLRFTFPSIVMMIFTSIYGVIDGIFVSNFVGATEFAAVNLILPFLMFFSAVGFMVGAGGTALVSKTLGEGNVKMANEIFSLLIYSVIVVGILFSIIGILFVPMVAEGLGATGKMLDACITYGRINFLSVGAYMLQNAFQSFLIAAERPKLGLRITVIAGLTNIGLDALFMAGLGWGVEGAAIATTISEFLGGIIPLIYFIRPKNSTLRLGKTHFELRPLIQTSSNGFSEFLSSISFAVINTAYNYQLMRIVGEQGIFAYGIITYTGYIFLSIFFGYAMGVAPIIGYHYGAQDRDELKSLFLKSLQIVTAFSVILTLVSELFSPQLASAFVSDNMQLEAFTLHAIRIYYFSFLLIGYNIFTSAFFTSLNNGPVSAFISFARTFVFQITCIFLLPIAWGIDGIWSSVIVSEFLAVLISIYFLYKHREVYGF